MIEYPCFAFFITLNFLSFSRKRKDDMRIIQGTKRILKPLVDFPTWMGYRTLVDNGKAVITGVKELFAPPQPERTESFEQAIERLGLTEKDIQLRKNVFLGFSIFWGLLTIGAFAYTCWLFFNGGFKGGLLGLSLSLFAAILCFRYHFWYFQVKNRLLGASFTLWFNALFGIKK
jgi:intracellular multiplication protein IcmV